MLQVVLITARTLEEAWSTCTFDFAEPRLQSLWYIDKFYQRK